MPPRRSRPTPLLLPLLLFFIVPLLGLLWFKWNSRPVDATSTGKINFQINTGQGLDSIGTDLKQQDLIRSLATFKIEVLLSGNSKKIQAGDFALSRSMDLSTLVTALTHGTTDRWVTFLEGWRREEYTQALIDNLSTNNEDYAFDPDVFLALSKSLEGHLFPDTYSFPRSATASAIIARLTTRFDSQTANLPNRSGLTDAQALVLASIVERESRTDRATVAGILLNRFRENAALRADATVQYALSSRSCRLLTCDWWPKDLTREDLAIDSPYNTYKYPGLPPAPISNPSLDAIKAAYNPADTDYWYYLHDPQGQIHYAKTLEQHNANIQKYLR